MRSVQKNKGAFNFFALRGKGVHQNMKYAKRVEGESCHCQSSAIFLKLNRLSTGSRTIGPNSNPNFNPNLTLTGRGVFPREQVSRILFVSKIPNQFATSNHLTITFHISQTSFYVKMCSLFNLRSSNRKVTVSGELMFLDNYCICDVTNTVTLHLWRHKTISHYDFW